MSTAQNPLTSALNTKFKIKFGGPHLPTEQHSQNNGYASNVNPNYNGGEGNYHTQISQHGSSHSIGNNFQGQAQLVAQIKARANQIARGGNNISQIITSSQSVILDNQA